MTDRPCPPPTQAQTAVSELPLLSGVLQFSPNNPPWRLSLSRASSSRATLLCTAAGSSVLMMTGGTADTSCEERPWGGEGGASEQQVSVVLAGLRPSVTGCTWRSSSSLPIYSLRSGPQPRLQGGSLSGPGARDGDSSSVLPAEAPLMTSGCSFLHASALWSSEIWSWRPHLFCSPF
ncbi:unnamed protein product [Rangifer tarandus platyrhynchus]|uniref:Uncharacterized protein n=1 Tax=Rangifer tarandus platyrhynchus TaxID=3082113 RepID=A0AC59Z1F0_RANTA